MATSSRIPAGDLPILGIPVTEWTVQHGTTYAGSPACSVALGFQGQRNLNTFESPELLTRLGEALIRAGEALAARQEAHGA